MARFNENLPLSLVFANSIKYYNSNKVDDKKERSKIDVRSGKIILKNNFEYDRSTKTWKQTGQSSKLVMEVKTVPESYKKIDTVNVHIYPITFEFKDISLGGMTPFKWRDGSQKRPIFNMPGKTSQDIANMNIRSKIQMQFFFTTEWVSKISGTLWGVCRANRPPRKTNPKNLLYFSKHDVFLLQKIIFPFLSSGKNLGKMMRPSKNNESESLYQ